MIYNGKTIVAYANFNGAAAEPKELTESWKELRTRIRNGDYDGINIGDYKTITLEGGESVVMEVAGIDTYYGSGSYYNRTGHHIDFISRDCLESIGLRQYNSTNTNNGGKVTEANGSYWAQNPYKFSELGRALSDMGEGSIWSELPEDLRDCIYPKIATVEHRQTDAGEVAANTGEGEEFLGYLWLPFELEVFGRHDHSDARYGSGGGSNMQYPIFKNTTKHLEKGFGKGGERTSWWMASAYANSKYSFLGVSVSGQSGIYIATEKLGVPLCFRIK